MDGTRPRCVLRRGLRGPEEPSLELLAMGSVIHPVAGSGDPLAGRYCGGMPDDRDQVAVAPRLYPDDTKPVLGVLIGDPLNQPRQHLSIGWNRLRLHMPGT